jgi:hypothetical protein
MYAIPRNTKIKLIEIQSNELQKGGEFGLEITFAKLVVILIAS